MRIGILTFHRAHNYGAVLQCYALQTFLEQSGHDVEIIDYLLDDLLECYQWFNRNRIIRKNLLLSIKELSIILYKKARYDNFNSFIANKLRIVKVDKILKEPFDYIIIGSDQVWSVKLTKGFDNYYWGCFDFPNSTKLISYAASLEEFWDEQYNDKVKGLLERFDSISVREDRIKQKLEKIGVNKHIVTVVDPTLLLKQDMWNRIVPPPSIKKRYVFYYQVRKSSLGMAYAKRIASERNLKLIVLSASFDLNNSKECITSSPSHFLGWIKYADFVVSSSFHGTVFSIIFNRPFVSISNHTKDDRVTNLLSRLHLENHIIRSMDDECVSEKYFSVSNDLDSYLTDSKDYLNSINKEKVL